MHMHTRTRTCTHTHTHTYVHTLKALLQLSMAQQQWNHYHYQHTEQGVHVISDHLIPTVEHTAYNSALPQYKRACRYTEQHALQCKNVSHHIKHCAVLYL